MDTISTETVKLPTTIAPWLKLNDGQKAIKFYQDAFGAIEKYRMEDPDGGLVAFLEIDGAGFWLSSEAIVSAIQNNAVRMILTVADPDTLFARAIEAGAKMIFPVGEEYGWRLGRIEDPYGYHWEIGRPI